MKIKIEVSEGDVVISRTAEGNYGVWETAEENLGKLQRMWAKQDHDCHASPEDGCEACDKQLEG